MWTSETSKGHHCRPRTQRPYQKRGHGPSETDAAALTTVAAAEREGGVSKNGQTLGHALLASTRHDELLDLMTDPSEPPSSQERRGSR